MSRIRFPKRPAFRKRPKIQPGAPPGTISVDPEGARPRIHVTAYGPDSLEELDLDDPRRIMEIKDKWPALWVHVEGLGDAAAIESLGEIFSLHKLALEDVVSRHQRPKLESYEDHLYIVALAVHQEAGLDFGQVNLFVGERFVLSLQERPLDWAEPVRKRIREGRTRIRRLGANYLGYALLDAIVDHYFPVLEHYGTQLEQLEDEMLVAPAADDIQRIHEIRSQVLSLRRALMPLGEVARELARDEMPPITDETRLFFRDCADHVSHLIELIETDRETARGLIDLSLANQSNRMNEVMKVLTIIATIFIPLGFIAGLYGMNFDPSVSPLNMPETRWYFGYPFALLLMLITVVGLLVFFGRKGWLGSPPRKPPTEG